MNIPLGWWTCERALIAAVLAVAVLWFIFEEPIVRFIVRRMMERYKEEKKKNER
jgi:peptidoglycan/LPS O-acetylase OafA/YrhL